MQKQPRASANAGGLMLIASYRSNPMARSAKHDNPDHHDGRRTKAIGMQETRCGSVSRDSGSYLTPYSQCLEIPLAWRVKVVEKFPKRRVTWCPEIRVAVQVLWRALPASGEAFLPCARPEPTSAVTSIHVHLMGIGVSKVKPRTANGEDDRFFGRITSRRSNTSAAVAAIVLVVDSVAAGLQGALLAGALGHPAPATPPSCQT